MKISKLIKKISALALAVMLALTVFTGVTAMAETDGVWVLTSTDYYTPYQRTSNANEYYKYICSFDGFTENGSVRFSVDGGYKGPGDWHTATMHHECTAPESSYAPGETVTLTMTSIQENTVNGYTGGDGVAMICSEDLESPYDGRDRFFKNTYANFNLESGSLAIASPNTSCTAFADMPKSAEYGDRVAVVFIDTSASDYYGSTYELGYGGHQFYEWIYTFMSKEEASTAINEASTTISPDQGSPADTTTVPQNNTTGTTADQSHSDYDGNLLVNPDWENGIEGWMNIDTIEEEYEEGKAALRSIVYQEIDLTKDQEGAKVSFGGWIGVDDQQPGQDQIRISLSFYSADGSLISYDSRSEYGYSLVYHEINLAVPIGAAYMRASVSIRKQDRGNSFYFDGLSLTLSQVTPGGSFSRTGSISGN